MYGRLEISRTSKAEEAPIRLLALPVPPAVRETTEVQNGRRRGRLAGLYRSRLLLVLGLLVLILASGGVWAGRRLLAVHYLKMGRDQLERYHAVEARPHLEACLQLWPGHPEALLLLARAARRAEAPAVAEQYLAEYLQLHGPTEALTLEEILHSAAKGETDKVAKHCRQIVQTNGVAASLALEAMVQGYFRMYRLGEGFAVLQTWLEREPNNTQALLFLGGLHALRQRRAEAVETYGRILELDPDHSMARLRLAMILLDENKPAEALTHLHYLQEHQGNGNPTKPMILVLAARCLDQLGQEEQGEQLREEVLAQYPHFGPALGDRGRWALRQGRWIDAETWLREALALEPTNRELRYQLSQCLFKNGKNTEAESELQRLRQIESDLVRLETITNHELLQRPGDPVLHLELGRLLLRQGQSEEGLHWLHRVLQANPTNVYAHQVLADYYQQVGDSSRAAYHRRFWANTSSGQGTPAP
jgi:Flp pilus assembly protein TadD